MRRFSTICLFTVALIILTLSLALAGSKFKNEDTAKNRQDNVFGTDPGDDTSAITFGTNDRGDSTMKTKARPSPEPVDWYDKVIINVNPSTQWPKGDGTTTTTTATTDTSNSTGAGNYTNTTTTDVKKW